MKDRISMGTGANHVIGIGTVTLLVVVTLLLTNWLRDRQVSPTLSRHLAGTLGGFGFLFAVVMLEPPAAIVLSFSITIAITLLRCIAKSQLRGLRKGVPENDWGEIAYPLAGAISLALGWGLLDDRWLGFVPIGFMAWGDSIAGITRSYIRSSQPASDWPSAAMLAVCLGVAVLYQPYWIAAAGALAAVIAERFRLSTHRMWDDNWTIVAASLAVMIVLRR